MTEEKTALTFEEWWEAQDTTKERCDTWRWSRRAYEAGVQAERARRARRTRETWEEEEAAAEAHIEQLNDELSALQSALSEKNERIKELEGALREASVLFHTRRGMCIYPGTEGDMYSVQGAHAELCQRTDDLLKD